MSPLATRLAEGLGATASLIHVVSSSTATPIGFRFEFDAIGSAWLTGGENLLTQMAAQMMAVVDAVQILREGDPALEIVAAAKQNGSDLIVMGTHGRKPIGQLLQWSTAAHVVRHTPCPVLTVARNPANRVGHQHLLPAASEYR